MLNVTNIIRSLTQYSENRSASFCWNKRMESVHKRLVTLEYLSGDISYNISR